MLARGTYAPGTNAYLERFEILETRLDSYSKPSKKLDNKQLGLRADHRVLVVKELR